MDEAMQDRQILKDIFIRLNRGELVYSEAAKEAQPIIDRINARNRAITFQVNKKHGVFRRPYKETFASLRRSQGLI